MSLGRLRGTIVSDGALSIMSSAEVHASIEVGEIEVLGNLQGNITKANQVILKNSSTFNGDIICKNIIIENGATVNGSINME